MKVEEIMAKENILSSVDNTLELIEILSKNKEMRVTEISKIMGLGKSTVYRILQTLKNRKFVLQNENEKYCLSLKFLEIGSKVQSRYSLIDIAHPYLEMLTNKFKETTQMGILTENEVIFIDKVSPIESSFQINSRIGAKFPLFSTACGKLFLAYSDLIDVQEYINTCSFSKYAKNTIQNKEDLLKELSEIKELGYSIDDEEMDTGVFAYAIPVFNNNNKIISSISVCIPAFRAKENKEDILDTLRFVANKIKDKIGNF